MTLIWYFGQSGQHDILKCNLEYHVLLLTERRLTDIANITIGASKMECIEASDSLRFGYVPF